MARSARRHRRFAPYLGAALVAFALWGTTACEGEDARSCSADDDCFSNEVCQDGICFRLDGSDTGASDASTDTAGEDTGSPDTGSSDTGAPDTSEPGDTSTGDTGSADSATPDAGDDTGASCQVDPFEGCSDDDPFQPAGATERYRLVPDAHEDDRDETIGCWWNTGSVSWGDAFGADVPLVQGTLCPATNDTYVDEFVLPIHTCTGPFTVDVYLRSTTCHAHADALLMDFRHTVNELPEQCDEQQTDGSYRHYVCPSDFVIFWREDVTDDAGTEWDQHVRIQVPGEPYRPDYADFHYIELTADASAGVAFEYELKVDVTQN